MMLSNHHRAKSCFFHLVYDTRKIHVAKATVAMGGSDCGEDARVHIPHACFSMGKIQCMVI
jgi:hypothetical protein